MPPEVECVVAQSKFESKGLFGRIYNVVEAAFRQGDVNHITGDVHFLSYLMCRRKTLLTILDCGTLHRSKGIRRFFLRLFWYVIPERRVSLISVISQSTKNELLKYLDCDPDKIRVAHICIPDRFVRFDRPFNAGKPKILQMGTLENKNLLRVIEAIKGVSCRLDIVGKLTKEQEKALSDNGVDYLNSYNISEDEVLRKYNECDMLVFVSTYEGFGMPILEANAVGRPVVTSDILSMPEVAGDAACIVNPYDVSAIRAGITRVINDKPYREKLVGNGFQNAARFDPGVVAGQYLRLYKEIAGTN